MKKYGLFVLLLAICCRATELPLPRVPATLTAPSERADYILQHFWDGMNWGDSTLTADETFMGQNFANFISVIPHATPAGSAAAIDTMLLHAAAQPSSAEAIANIAEAYLLGHRSPIRNDSLYAAIADGMVAHGYPGAFRIAALADMARRNAPGSDAPDFSFTLRADGRTHSLHQLMAGKKTILVFYDPDCHNCTAAIAALDASAAVSYSLLMGDINVVAIYSGDDTDLWTASAAKIPSGWYDGTDGGTVFDSELYSIPETPTLYLIDSNGRILLKDATVDEIIGNIR